MGACIQTTAKLKGGLNTTAALGGALSLEASISSNSINTTATLKTNIISATTSLIAGIVTTASILNSGINSEPCPLILCIDGGDAFTTVYPPINGLLNGGSA